MENTRLLKRFGKQHGRNMKATCARTWESTRFLKSLGSNMDATWKHHAPTPENTRFLKRLGKQHGRNMKSTCAKPRKTPGSWKVLESNMDATWKQHAQEPGKTAWNLRKQHGCNMGGTRTKSGENTRFLKRFGKQHGRHMEATRTKTPSYWKVLASMMDTTWKQHAQKTWESTGFLELLERDRKATRAKT